ncbi:MAG: hypothetical protein JJ920_00310 [Roseitalea sp.]|nr:hypothetical protein [Roseitalea sp.]MBO6741320.1 hypothetical protein [Roseitalea sp.]
MPDHQRQTRADRLDYIRAMLGQLRAMAEAERCDLLTYLIEMAYIEAGDVLSGERPSGAGSKKRDTVA